MGWKLLYILTSLPLIAAIEMAGLAYRGTEWLHGRLIKLGIQWTPYCAGKVKGDP